MTVLLVAVLSFLIPWMSKTIEEPFQGCLTPSASIPIVLPAQGPTARTAEYIETGKQRYNFLGFLEAGKDTRAFMGPSAVGSLSTDPILGAPAGADTPLRQLNTNIKSALETVSIVPGNGVVTTQPDVELAPSASGVQVLLKNASTFFGDVLQNGGIMKPMLGMVEEQLPPLNGKKDDAARCEVNNMYYQMKTGTETSDLTSYAETVVPRKRADLCTLLDADKTNTNLNQITNAFPNAPNKICGVCIKNAAPFSDPSVYNPAGKDYNGIGGMFMSLADKNATDAAGRTYKPSLGTCEEGYFFLPGEKDKCMKAAQQLNCSEIAVAGGFVGGRSNDRTDVSGSSCFACTQGAETRYAYYEPRGASSVRVRIVVPTGTGVTYVSVQNGTGTSIPFRLRSKKSGVQQNTLMNFASGENFKVSNSVYFIMNAAPGDKLKFTIVQEFPHRPRGEKEVFFVQFPSTTDSRSSVSAAELADSLDCDIATPDQLIQAQQEGMNVCFAGIAKDGNAYTVRSGTVSSNPFVDVCSVDPEKGSVQKTDQPASGVWCYGIKPKSDQISKVELASVGEIINPRIENHYTYYKQKIETGISPEARISRWSSKDANTYPNYRGVCIQLEQNNTAAVDTYQNINVGIENHIVRVGNADISGVRIIAERLKHYSRNGRFSDSERIATPKPNSGVPFGLINENQYWLWGPQGTAVFNVEVEVPGYFSPPTHLEDRARCSSALYTNQTYLTRAIGSECDNGLDDADTSGCIARCFRLVGGDLLEGTLSPQKGLENRKRLLYKDYDANTGKRLRDMRTAEEIVDYLTKNYVEVAKGTAPFLQGLSQAERTTRMNEASQALIGKDAVGPCQKLYQMQGTAGTELVVKEYETIEEIDEKCLDYLYRNTGTKGPATYANMASSGAYSGLKWPGEYTTASTEEITEYPYRACQPEGSWNPTKGPAALKEIKDAIGSISNGTTIGKAIAVFNDIYTKANSSTNSAEQELALKRCYGISKKSYVTNCDGISTKFLFVYEMADPPTFVDISGTDWSIKVNEGGTTPITVEKSQRRTKGGKEFEMTNVLTSVYANFGSVQLTSNQTLGNLRVIEAISIGSWIGKTKYDNFVENTPANANDRQFIYGVKHDKYYKMVRISFQKINYILQSKIIEARYYPITDLPNPFSESNILNYWLNGTIANIATSDIMSGYGVRSMKITFDNATDKAYYEFSSATPVQNVTISKTGIGPLLIVLRDGPTIGDGVAAQKLVTPTTASSITVKFLQEDLRPFVMYDSVKTGATFRFESAIGKQYFLQSNGLIAKMDQTASEDQLLTTKFILKESQLSNGTPVNTLQTMEDSTQFLFWDPKSDNVTKGLASNTNKDWSIVPALNGAYAFVSILLATTPGIYLKAVKVGNVYKAQAVRIDPDNDVDAFFACWRLYPAL